MAQAMSPTLWQIILLGLVQGAAELLPVSSSAHVIVAEKLLRLDPSAPEMTFLLVMLHTGTMAAVILYFWQAWRRSYFSSAARLGRTVAYVALATGLSGALYLVLKKGIEKVFFHGEKAEVEALFSNLPLIAGALAAVGVLIVVAGLRQRKDAPGREVGPASAAWIGLVQGVCLPFRGFSRSGATISTALLLDVDRRQAEEFSFALAVVLTPPAVAIELLRLIKNNPETVAPDHLAALVGPGLLGLVCAFLAGLLALKFLSSWLEHGKWHFFGYYCFVFAAVVAALAAAGF
jgi:undecaprenyl-diphosphatase